MGRAAAQLVVAQVERDERQPRAARAEPAQPVGREHERDRRAVLAHRLDRLNEFDWLINEPDQVDDSMLVAVLLACSLTEEQNAAWTERMQSLMP